MRGQRIVGLAVAGWVVVASAGVAAAEGGTQPRALSSHELRGEADRNEALQEYLDLYGLPDYAEARSVPGDFPWDTREVWVYYLERDRAVAFGTAFIVGRPWVSLIRAQGPVPPDRAAQIRRLMRGPVALADDAEAAATRSEAAADRALVAADSAEAAVERAEKAAAGLEEGFWTAARK